MPLTPFQEAVAKLLSANRSFDSYLAGGAAIPLEPQTSRYSHDLDYFQDSTARVAAAFTADRQLLEDSGYAVRVELQLPGFIRATVTRQGLHTKVEWSHDSAWRFMPTVRHAIVGFALHPIDLATNKLLAVAGRDEPRDFLDLLDLHEHVLSIGALCWAAAGKDPGYTPFALLDILRRRGKYQPEDFRRLHVTAPVDLPSLKARWLAALDDAEVFVRSRPADEVGCLYYSRRLERFVTPGTETEADVVPHFGRPGGLVPLVVEEA